MRLAYKNLYVRKNIIPPRLFPAGPIAIKLFVAQWKRYNTYWEPLKQIIHMVFAKQH